MWLFIGLVSLLGCTATAQQCGTKPPQDPWTEPDDVYGDVVNGREADPHSWPWQASLKFNSTGDPYHTCGAVVIDPFWALTAAHCVEGRQVGLNDSRREDPSYFWLDVGLHSQFEYDTPPAERHAIDMIIRHDGWIPDPYKGFPNDIAMLRVPGGIDLSGPETQPACVPQQQDMDFVGEECWISGWGLTNFSNADTPEFLHEGPVEGISNTECEQLNFGYIRDTHICAGTGGPGNVNSCSGDSGGPMHCLKDGTWYVAGLASWGVVGCQAIPTVYTRVSKFWDWVDWNKLVYAP